MQGLQQGSVLLISLICLLLLTLVGVSAMKLTSLDERMSGNYRDREMAFQSAEAALVEAENFIENTPFTLTDFYSSCSGDNCFTSDCDGGLCFTGTFTASSQPVGSCILDGSKPWENWSLWEDSNQVREATALAEISAQAKYIIEFRCFIVSDPSNVEPDTNELAQWALSFRITALARGGTRDSKVMLQTTYKKLDF